MTVRLKVLIYNAVILIGSIVLVSSVPAQAQTQLTERLSQCLVLNSTGANRLALMKWLAFAIASHPSVRDVMAVPPSEVDRSDKEIATLLTELLVVKCPEETRAVLTSSGDSSSAMEIAFEELGRMAAQEMMSSPGLDQRMSSFTKYLDPGAFEALSGQ